MPPSLTIISSPGSTSRRKLAPITSSATVSLAKIVASPSLPITSGRMPSGSRQAIRPSSVRHDERVSPFDLLQRVGQPVEHVRSIGGRDEMDDHLGVTGRLEDRAATVERPPELHRVRKIAVVRDREAALGKLGEQRLDIAKRGLARGRIADMADRRRARRGGGSHRHGRNCRRHDPSLGANGNVCRRSVVMPAASWPRCWSA